MICVDYCWRFCQFYYVADLFYGLDKTCCFELCCLVLCFCVLQQSAEEQNWLNGGLFWRCAIVFARVHHCSKAKCFQSIKVSVQLATWVVMRQY